MTTEDLKRLDEMHERANGSGGQWCETLNFAVELMDAYPALRELAEIGLAAVEARKSFLAYATNRNEAQAYYQQHGNPSEELIKKDQALSPVWCDAANKEDELIDAYLAKEKR